MENIIAQMIPLISPQAIPLVFVIICCVFLYLKIGKERKQTKQERDNAQTTLETRITLLENEVQRLKDLDLETKLAQILTDLQWLKERFKDN
jgi:hypothetical protein